MGTKAKAVLDAMTGAEENWVDALSRDVRDAMLGPDGEGDLVPAELRIKILTVIEERCRPHAVEQAKTIWKLQLQRRALSIYALILMVVLGLGWFRILHVESMALARAWRLLNERQVVAAQTGKEAAKQGMIWVTERVKEIDAEPEDSPEARQDKHNRRGNVITMGNQVLAQMKACDMTIEKLSHVDYPERIDRFTYFKDPYTGKTLPMNATVDGRISQADVDLYLKQDNLIVRMLAAAKAYSQPGAEPLPPFLFDNTQAADREKFIPSALQNRLKAIDTKVQGEK